MPTGIGLMGLGRIGRNLFRILYKRNDIRIEAVSDLADPAGLAYLLRFDTILGRFPDELSVKDGTSTRPAGRSRCSPREGRPATPPWGDLGVDTVIEATSSGRTRAEVEATSRPGPSG